MCLDVNFIVKMVKKLFLAADLGHISRVQIVFKSLVKSGYWVPNMVTETLTS